MARRAAPARSSTACRSPALSGRRGSSRRGAAARICGPAPAGDDPAAAGVTFSPPQGWGEAAPRRVPRPLQILPGLFIGNFKDARDVEQLSKNNITHILSIHDSARPMLEGVKYLCIPAADSPSQNLARHFRESIKFIHECRLTGEGCLVHCLAGVSRSVTLVVAYIMTITDFGWEDALSVVRAARSCANPNMGFQRQLQDFEKHDVNQFRQWLKEEYGENSSQDLQEAKNLLSKYKEQAELHQSTGGRQWNNNFSSVPSLSYSNYTTET
ncbi:dual specificity protein phosphatase 22 isoform X1 [Columba livia]|uniref:dual specificity protein phosphatase 22 isoform X1 n=3 Tax=Columba livia TaxID=8932 RepID=UPI0031BB2F65